MADIEDIIASASLPETKVALCLAGALQADFEDLERQLRDLKGWEPDSLGDADPRRELAERMEALREEMRRHEVVFHLRALPAKQWSDMVAKHPPREGRDPAGVNLDTFGPAVLAACCLDPAMTVEQAQRLWDRLSDGQVDALWTAVFNLNRGRVDIPFSLAAFNARQSSGQR